MARNITCAAGIFVLPPGTTDLNLLVLYCDYGLREYSEDEAPTSEFLIKYISDCSDEFHDPTGHLLLVNCKIERIKMALQLICKQQSRRSSSDANYLTMAFLVNWTA